MASNSLWGGLWGGVKKFVKPIIQPWTTGWTGSSVPPPPTQATTAPPAIPQATPPMVPQPTPTPAPVPATPPAQPNMEDFVLKHYGPTVYQQTFGKAAPGATPAVPGATLPTPPVTAPTEAPATPQGQPTEPTAPPVPSATEKAQADAEVLYQKSLAISPEALSTQEDLDKLIEATKKGYLDVEGKPIAMGAISGQAGLIERRALAMAEPLERKLARLQAARTASLEASKFALERTDKRVEAERKAAEESAKVERERIETERKAPSTLGGGEMQWNPDIKKWEPTGYTKPEKETYPTSWEEWSLAGGLKGTGMPYGKWLDREQERNPGGYSDQQINELRARGIDPTNIKKADEYLYPPEEEKKQFLTKDWILETFGEDKLKTSAKEAGYRKFLQGWETEKENYLNYLVDLIDQYRKVGYTDKEILSKMQ